MIESDSPLLPHPDVGHLRSQEESTTGIPTSRPHGHLRDCLLGRRRMERFKLHACIVAVGNHTVVPAGVLAQLEPDRTAIHDSRTASWHHITEMVQEVSKTWNHGEHRDHGDNSSQFRVFSPLCSPCSLWL